MTEQLIRIVIAEDDARIAEIQQRFVEQVEGFEVLGLSHSLEQTAQMVEILQPDLLLLDIHFQDGNGLDFLKNLREQDQHTDVILMTAARDIETLKSAMHGGIFDYIVKPLVFERIQDSLQRYQQHRQQLNSLQQVDQKTIDALLPRGGTSSSASNLDDRLPKGIDELTLTKVRDLFTELEHSLGASTVGETLGVSRTTARRYLEYLVSSGELVVDVNYGGVGRPERYYCRAS
ncbi:MAG: response regulator [Gammaproteobacteria bacterium]|nr:response regulator [Gammaproteobacteria bacterium]